MSKGHVAGTKKEKKEDADAEEYSYPEYEMHERLISSADVQTDSQGRASHDYTTTEERLEFGRVSPTALNTERVPLLASRWSVDPNSVDYRLLKENQGIAGQLSRSKAH